MSRALEPGPKGPRRARVTRTLLDSLDIIRKANPETKPVDGCAVAYRMVIGWGMKRVRRFGEKISRDDAHDIVCNALAAYLETARRHNRSALMKEFDRELERERRQRTRYLKRFRNLDREICKTLEGTTPKTRQLLDDILEEIFAQVSAALDSMRPDYHDVVAKQYGLDRQLKGGTRNPSENTKRRAREQLRDRLKAALENKLRNAKRKQILQHALVIVTTKGLLKYAFACSDQQKKNSH